jgi:hypothetical protein
MSQYGPSRFNAGFGGSGWVPATPPGPRPPERGPGVSRGFLMALLLVACIVLGALSSWLLRERNARALLSMRNDELEKAYTVVLARRSDLASFLTDGRTRLFTLAGRDEAAGRSVTVAWQEQTHSGWLIGDRIPVPADDERYVLWRVGRNGGGDKATEASSFRPDAAGTIDEFKIMGEPADGDTAGFRLSVEREREVKRPGRVVYETH